METVEKSICLTNKHRFPNIYNFFVEKQICAPIRPIEANKKELLMLNAMITPKLMTEEQASVYLSVSVSALQKSRSGDAVGIKKGLAPPYRKWNGKVRYLVDDLDAFALGLPRRGVSDVVSSKPNQPIDSREHAQMIALADDDNEDDDISAFMV